MAYPSGIENHPRQQQIEISIGNLMQIQPKGAKDYILGSLTGGKKGCYLIAETQPNPGFLNRLNKENQIIVRMIQDGIVYGFPCTLIRFLDKPFHLSFLSYPEKIEMINLRSHQRVSCFIPARMEKSGFSRPGTILDLSEGGCSFLCYLALDGNTGQELQKEDEIKISLQLAGEILSIPAVIRRIHADDRKISIGVAFNGLPPDSLETIRLYIQRISGACFDLDL